MNRKLPVFFHIPKNAGTYVSNIVWFIMDTFWYKILWVKYNENEQNFKGSLKNILIVNDKNHIIYRIYGYDHLSKKDNYDVEYSLDEFLNYINKGQFELFSIIIEAIGFNKHYDLLDKLTNFEFVKFAILREPLSREYSLYNYLKGEYSNHERNHNEIHSNSFEEYLNSEQLGDSWLIRAMLNVHDNTILADDHLNSIYKILDTFELEDIKNTDKLINKVFMECYKLNLNDINPDILRDNLINENINRNKKNERINDETLKCFKRKTKYEYKIYNRYVNFT